MRGDGQAIVGRLGIEHRLGNVGRNLAGSRRGEDLTGPVPLGTLPSDVGLVPPDGRSAPFGGQHRQGSVRFVQAGGKL
ncbi:MAG: hypothetical protein WKF56_01280 [Candidatus Limnocylindrales bacterium]